MIDHRDTEAQSLFSFSGCHPERRRCRFCDAEVEGPL